MSAAKTTAERVSAMRKAREELGLKRLELYLHPDDHAEVKEVAAKIARRRQRAEKRAAR